ncbi:MAG TPA: DUF5689 domain-containing protein [Bacteroidia bacterium]|nr:DUF5689 domain-containing protein [Bacteroidia bacterium]
MNPTLKLLVFLAPTVLACKKEFDSPPVKLANDGARITIQQVKAKYKPNSSYRFRNDSNLYCVVTADEQSGNLYKEVFVRDASGALHIKLRYSGGLYTGDSIRINLRGIVLNDYMRVIQLDSVDLNLQVVKLASGLKPAPETMDLEQVLASTAATNTVQSKLICLNNVEFRPEDRSVTLADAENRTSKTLVLTSCGGQSISVRSSGFANFASKLSPGGRGSLVAIVSQYGDKAGDMQLLLRQYSDMNMNLNNCQASGMVSYLFKDFNDNDLSSGGWTQQNVSGSISWTVSGSGGSNPYARISNYSSGSNQACETWLISPPVDLRNASKPMLGFKNAYNYVGPALELMLSTNYSTGDPTQANWIPLTYNRSAGNWVFVQSGAIDLGAYKQAGVRIAFKYKGSGSDGSTWEIDDVSLKEKE